MNGEKGFTKLNETDSLCDMLAAEKQLMSLYAAALYEGSSKSVRRQFLSNLESVASAQYDLFTQMSARGYYTPAPAEKSMIDGANDKFKKQAKSLKAQ